MKIKNLSAFLGLDIGSESIKAVYIQRSKDAYILSSYTISKHGLTDFSDPNLLGQAIKKTISQLGKSSRPVFVTFSSKNQVLRYQPLKNISEEDTRQNLKFNSSTLLNQDYSEYYLDCAKLPMAAPADPKAKIEQVKFLVAGAPKAEIDCLYQALSKIKLTPVMVQISGVSLLNSFEFSRIQDYQQSSSILVDIGHNLSLITIVNKGVPELARVLSFGGKNITEEIAKDMGCDPFAAEQAKIRGDENALASIENSLSQLIREIQASMNYAENSLSADIKRIHLSGGMARSSQIRDTIANAVGLPAEIWSPLDGLEVKLKSGPSETIQADFCALPPAIGAAIEGLYNI
ncbi:MAG: pilus assembly protein PilM [Verrucomicrobiae bacterium]|nr:pilus assembly protein PilM [Verrucomicrobiae bacterium]